MVLRPNQTGLRFQRILSRCFKASVNLGQQLGMCCRLRQCCERRAHQPLMRSNGLPHFTVKHSWRYWANGAQVPSLQARRACFSSASREMLLRCWRSTNGRRRWVSRQGRYHQYSLNSFLTCFGFRLGVRATHKWWQRYSRKQTSWTATGWQ